MRLRLAIVALLGLAILLGTPLLMRRSAFFRVRRVEVVGTRYLRADEVVAALHVAPTRSIIDPLDSLRAVARRIPGVVAADVQRRLPGTLIVTVLEETPVALAPHEGILALVDSRGHPLPFDPSRQQASFPVADTGAAPAILLTHVLLASPQWYAEIESASWDQGDILLRAAGHRIRLRPDADLETLRDVLAVRTYLGQSARPWVEIDARYRGRVFVEKGAA